MNAISGRSLRRRLTSVLSLLALLISGLVASATSTAAADPPPGLQFNLKVDASAIAQARASANKARARGGESAELKGLRSSLAKKAAASGTTYLSEDVEAFELSDRVSMAVTRGARVDTVNVTAERKGDVDTVVAEVSADTEASAIGSTSQGQGMGWTYKRGGRYVIKIKGAGEMVSYFRKSRFKGSKAPQLMSMRRKAMGRGYDISGFNYSVTGMYISSHAKNWAKKNIRRRWHAKPASDFTGNCDSNTFSLGIKGLGWSFMDCDKNDVRWTSGSPGYYRNYMTQGKVFRRGDREVGFHNVVVVRKGKAVAYKHYQRLEMARFVYPADKCGTWGSGKTCN